MSKLAEANRALREKKYDQALLLYQQILQTQPELYELVRGNVRILRQRCARDEPPGLGSLENDQAFVELCSRLDQCVDEFGKGVSIIIPTLNAAALLERLLTTFFQVNTHEPVALIVVDHGSTDGTAERVAGFMRQYPGVIQWVNRGMNHSFSSSCNLGARRARYPYLLFLHDDLIYTADVLPRALATLREPGIGAVGVRLEDDPEALPVGRMPTVQHTGVRLVWNERRQYCQPEQIRHPTVVAVVASGVFPAVTAAFLLCRQADFEALEGFCTAYEDGLEDIDFCLRLGVQLRKRCWCVNEMALQHREGATRNRGDQAARRAITDRNHRLFKQRWAALTPWLADPSAEILPGLRGEPKRLPLPLALARAERLPTLNILFVLYGQLDSNSGYHAQLHTARLQALGADAIFAVPDVVHAADPEPASPGADALRVLAYSAVLATPGALPFRNRQGPQVIHAWTPREIVRRFVEELRQQRPVPVVVHLEDNEEYLTAVTVGQPFAELAQQPVAELDQRIPAHRYHPVRGRAFLAQAQGLTVIIETLERFKAPGQPCRVLPPPVDQHRFYPRPLNGALRRELGIAEESVALVYTGNVHEANAAEVRELYRAVALLNERGCPTVLIRTGNGQPPGQEEWLTAYERRLGWVARARLPEMLAAADVLVQPGWPGPFDDERIPSKLPEFFAMSRPVILPRTNLGLQVAHEQEAYVLDRADAEGMAEAIWRLQADPALRQRLAGNAAYYAIREFCDFSGQETTALYQWYQRL